MAGARMPGIAAGAAPVAGQHDLDLAAEVQQFRQRARLERAHETRAMFAASGTSG